MRNQYRAHGPHRLGDRQRQVLALIDQLGRPVTTAEIAALVGLTYGQAHTVLYSLEAAGSMRAARHGRLIRWWPHVWGPGNTACLMASLPGPIGDWP